MSDEHPLYFKFLFHLPVGLQNFNKSFVALNYVFNIFVIYQNHNQHLCYISKIDLTRVSDCN